jgi:hypothetical protein
MRKNIELEKEIMDDPGKGSRSCLKEEVKKEMLESSPDGSSEVEFECAMDCCECKNKC